MAAVTVWRVICQFFSVLLLRLLVAVAYATGFNAVIFLPLEVDVRWGAWTGVSMNTVNQEQFATSWYLSAMEGFNGLRTSLFYGRHTQDVGAQDSSNSNRVADALSFTKASYLYHVITDDGDELVLNWDGRSTTEVLDPRQGDTEPDGYQEKYQILYLSSVNKGSGGTYSSSSGFSVDATPLMQVDLDYNSEVLLGFDDPSQYMGKRILTEITPGYYNFYKTQTNEGQAVYDPQPSYSFSYWGQSKIQQTADGASLENDDGVSVSRWNDANGFNANNGALYGLLKTVTSPEGLTGTFRYSNAQGTGIQRSLIVSNDDLKLTNYRHAYVGPGYMLVSGSIDNWQNIFYIYAWTSQGWKQVVAQKSREGGFTTDFTLDPDTNKSNNMSNWVAAGNGIVGVLMPSNGDKDTNATCFDVYVFAQDRGQETWSAIGDNSNNSPFFGNYCGNVRLDVSQNVVTVVWGEEQQYHVWYGGYASWLYDPSTDSVVRSPYASMLYYPPRNAEPRDDDGLSELERCRSVFGGQHRHIGAAERFQYLEQLWRFRGESHDLQAVGEGCERPVWGEPPGLDCVDCGEKEERGGNQEQRCRRLGRGAERRNVLVEHPGTEHADTIARGERHIGALHARPSAQLFRRQRGERHRQFREDQRLCRCAGAVDLLI